MKKILLTVAGAMLIGLAAVNAQERSDTTKRPSSDYRKDSGTQGENSTIQGKSGLYAEWPETERTTLTREELPPSLLETLKSDEYKGWETATIYRNNLSNDYMLVIQENDEIKTFVFDQEGQRREPDMNNPEQSGLPEQSGAGEVRTQDQTTTGESDDSSNKQSTELQTTEPKRDPSQDYSEPPVSPPQMPTGVDRQEPSTQWKNEDRVLITTSEIPSSLRITLSDEKYQGWEKSTVFRNRNTNEYMIEIRDGSESKIYYFDKDGKEIHLTDDDQ